MSNWGEYDRTNHIKNIDCTGTNVAYVDGHVEWRPFSEMQHRWFASLGTNPAFWW
jgi:prepilin-type processing-associated H-X9-DG protein